MVILSHAVGCCEWQTKKFATQTLKLMNKIDAPPKSAIHELLKDFYKNTQDLPIKRAPNFYASPHNLITVHAHNHHLAII